MKNLRVIPDVVRDQPIGSVRQDASVEEACRLMADFDVGALVVVDGGEALIGVVSERDVVRRVVAAGLDPAATKVAQAMTRNPDTLAPDDSAFDALELMSIRNVRHLPVVDGRKIVGVVSVRDLLEVASRELEEDIRETHASIFGEPYGG